MALIRFEYRRGAEEVDEVVSVDDDGAVSRWVSGAGSGASEVGWWRGEVEAGVLDDLRATRGTAPPSGARKVPPAAGQWWAVLDERPRPVAGDGGLAALVSVCARAASEPETVVSATAHVEEWEGEPAPVVLLRLRCLGDTPGDVRFDDAPDAPVSAFVTDELETLGFLGSTFTLTPPVEATAVVRRPTDDGRLRLEGVLGRLSPREEGEPLRFRLVVEVGPAPPADPEDDD